MADSLPPALTALCREVLENPVGYRVHSDETIVATLRALAESWMSGAYGEIDAVDLDKWADEIERLGTP